MVKSPEARQDVDDELLTKPIIYRRFSNAINDLAYETYDKTSYTDININVQCTIQSATDRYVIDGILKEGDLALFMRYEYAIDNNGNIISPILIPKKEDKVLFLGEWFVIKEFMPLTTEDSGIIGWDCRAGKTNG